MALRRLAPLLLAVLLAGCSGSEPADDAVDDAATVDAGALAAGLPSADDPTHRVEAPVWQVGQWWEWQTDFASGPQDGTFCSIVAQAGAAPVLATEKEEMAKEEAAFGHPLLGALSAGLGLQGFGGDWSLLQFPLTDGKAWTATLPNIAWDVVPEETVSVPVVATWDAALPGYRIMGHLEQGMVLEATYLPATGWFGELKLYDVDPGQEELEIGWTAKSAGLDYKGPAFTATAAPLIQLQDGNGLTAPPPEGQPFVQPQPQGTFTMQSGTTLYGGLFAASVFGTRVVTLTDPNGQQRQVVSTGAGLEEDERSLWIDEPGVAGQWTVVTSGAGGFSMGYVQLFEVTVTQSTL